MLVENDIDESETARLRIENYNATVVSIRRCHDELMVIRVRPDRGLPLFLPGQYTVLGLGYWEPRAPNCQPEGDNDHLQKKLIKRAYSISSPISDDTGRLVGVNDVEFLEFYITLIRQADERPPALTPRIFALQRGSRIFCGPHIHGNYTLHNVARDSNVVFAATGTGEAPHNAMLAQLLKTGHRGRIVNVTCVRRNADLGYLATHRRIEAMCPRYRYVALTTREPENLDASRPEYVGKRYLQDYFSSDFESETGLPLDSENTHVFLCGNPDMIGVPLRTHDRTRRYPQPKGMVETLENIGFHIDRPHHRGNIHFEKYWQKGVVLVSNHLGHRHLGRMFGLHPLALEDVVNVHQQVKVEDYGDHLFLVGRLVDDTEHVMK